MTIQTNDPFPIHCPTPPPTGPPLESCRNMRKNIPAGGQIQSFGPRGAEVDVPLPFNFDSSKTLPRSRILLSESQSLTIPRRWPVRADHSVAWNER